MAPPIIEHIPLIMYIAVVVSAAIFAVPLAIEWFRWDWADFEPAEVPQAIRVGRHRAPSRLSRLSSALEEMIA